MNDAAEARRRLRAGMFPDPNPTRPETTTMSDATTPATEVPAPPADLYAMAKAWHEAGGELAALEEKSREIDELIDAQYAKVRAAAEALGDAVFPDSRTAGRLAARAIEGKTGVVTVVNDTDDVRDADYTVRFVPFLRRDWPATDPTAPEVTG